MFCYACTHRPRHIFLFTSTHLRTIHGYAQKQDWEKEGKESGHKGGLKGQGNRARDQDRNKGIEKDTDQGNMRQIQYLEWPPPIAIQTLTPALSRSVTTIVTGTMQT